MEFRFDVIREAMDLQGITFSALSKLCGSPESTLKKLAKGDISDPRISTIVAPFKILGLSVDRACGLAPERDISKEAAFHDANITQALQERISLQDTKLSEHRHTIMELRSDLSAEKEKSRAFENLVHERDQTITDYKDRVAERQRKVDHLSNQFSIMRYALLGIIVVLVIGIGYFAWELINFDKGATGVLLRQYLEQ